MTDELSTTRLIGFEAATLRALAALSDDDLAGVLAEAIDTVASDTNGTYATSDLRELGCASILTARRMEAGR